MSSDDIASLDEMIARPVRRGARRFLTPAACLLSGMLVACDSGSSGGPSVPDPFTAAPVCSSAVMWDPNESPGPSMGPGRTCNQCHAEENATSGEGDAPIFAFAGTAYPTAHEPDDCVGVGAAGAIVEVTDARGIKYSIEANSSGNFFEEDPAFVYPYKARVISGGRTREMRAPQFEGDCNSCHTPTGANAAPGRILLP